MKVEIRAQWRKSPAQPSSSMEDESSTAETDRLEDANRKNNIVVKEDNLSSPNRKRKGPSKLEGILDDQESNESSSSSRGNEDRKALKPSAARISSSSSCHSLSDESHSIDNKKKRRLPDAASDLKSDISLDANTNQTLTTHTLNSRHANQQPLWQQLLPSLNGHQQAALLQQVLSVPPPMPQQQLLWQQHQTPPPWLSYFQQDPLRALTGAAAFNQHLTLAQQGNPLYQLMTVPRQSQDISNPTEEMKKDNR
eukprot:CAMPEP_0206364806 /NCGR_PEP_ID=MMETSP0294-20121207/2446_1 /ASSEMBLY_ACC=CAM_ASM_000327 /TAXON_ID=39354 /ORGANISM="Heterosigma akashiwo, Strain CCMP2393" /LENGTH=252 /DNA_ID=CAMNT_0053810491 /DNA_START=178 /DNA_END=936 /DNA_ORIENTATION=+